MAALQQECGGTFVSNRRSTLKTYNALFPNAPTSRRYRYMNFLGGHKELKHADVIFSCATYGKYLPQFAARKYMVFHGTFGTMPEWAMQGWADFDHLFLNGPRMERHLLRYNDKYQLKYSTVGHIPFALYPDKTPESRIQILQKLNLNTQKKTVVYTPSKAVIGSWLHCAEAIARETPPDYNLILRPHPNQANSRKRADVASFESIKKLTQQRPNCLIDLSICSLPELESIADLMITDANSPAEESLFYDCPQLFADANRSSKSELRKYLFNDGVHQDDIEPFLELFDCGPARYADGFNNWAEAIDFAVERQSEYAECRSRCFENIFGPKDRDAAKRVAKKITELFS